MIEADHLPAFRESILQPQFLADPVLILGFHETERLRRRSLARRVASMLRHPSEIPHRLRARGQRARSRGAPELENADLAGILESFGRTNISVLDLFDERADVRYDLNQPVPPNEHERYGLVIDIGTIEHIFDTRAAMENCLRMVKVGGRYFLHTPVKGYFNHGLHTFAPDAVLDALRLNGFVIEHASFWTREGLRLADPNDGDNVLIFVRGRKEQRLDEFVSPQQGSWKTFYDNR